MFIQIRNFLVPILNALADKEYELHVRSEHLKCKQGLADIPERARQLKRDRDYFRKEIKANELRIVEIENKRQVQKEEAAFEAFRLSEEKKERKLALDIRKGIKPKLLKDAMPEVAKLQPTEVKYSQEVLDTLGAKA